MPRGAHRRQFWLAPIAAVALAGLPTAAAQASDPGAPIVDTVDASTAAAATAIAKQFAHPVVVDALTDATDLVAAQPDGSFQLTESSVPARVRRGDSWIPVDLDLAASDGTWTPTAAPVPVRFSAGGTGPMAQVQSGDGSWLSESWTAGALPAPTISGASATYTNVFPGVDLQLTATTDGMSSVLVVKSAVAAADPRLAAVRLDVTGTSVTPVAGTGGAHATAALQAADGLTAASPSWWDSSAPGSGTATGAAAAALPRPVDGTVSGTSLTLNVQAAAQSAGVVYPVYVDPDWTGGVDARTFVDSAYPTQSYWNGSGASDKYQHVGYVQSSWSDDGKAHKTRSFWRMSLAGVAGKIITKATFNTNEVWASSCNKREVDLYVTGGIGTGTTWNAQPSFGAKESSATVAYGYSSSCPAHSVGFLATGGVTSAVGAGDSYITLGLKATDETDTLTWKKFEPSATLVISYDTRPGTPSGLSVGGCGFVCSSPAYTKDATPALTATATDADGGTLNYTFSIYQGQSSTPGTAYRTGSVAGVASGAKATYTPASLPDGAYEYRVTASDGTASSSPSGLFKFTVDTVAPAPPKLTESGGLSIDANTPGGLVGSTMETVTITPVSTDDAYGYVYAIVPTGATVTFPTTLTCNTETAGYITVCGTVNAARSVTITAPDDHSTFSAATFDAAGNTRSTTSSVSFNALPDTASIAAGHSWTTDTSQSTCPGGDPGPIADTSATEGQILTLGGSTCWGQDAGAPNPTGGVGAGVLNFDGTTTAAAATSTGVLTTTANFTVAAWVYPTKTGSGYFADAMGQDGTGDSAFFLQQNDTQWDFCVSSADTAASWQGHCAVTPVGSLVANQWTFVVGEYNAVNDTATLRISNSNGIGLQTPVIASATSAAFTGPLQVGRAWIYGAYRPWNGEILDPVAIQGIADTAQLQRLMQMTPPSQL